MAGRRRRPDQAARDHHRRHPRVGRVLDGARPRRDPAPCDARSGRRDPQPDLVVRLGDLGSGRQLRRRVSAARDPRAVEGTDRAIGDPGRARGAGQATARDPGADHRRGHHPPRPVARGRLRRRGTPAAVGARLGTPDGRSDTDPDHGSRGLPDRRRHRRAVRAVGHRAHRHCAVRRLVAAAAGVQHRSHLPVRDRERLQPVGPVPGRRQQHGDRRHLAVRRARPAGRRMGGDRASPGRARRRRAAARAGRRDLAAGRPAPGPAHDPGRRVRPRDRLLRRPDPGPRALPVPAVRPGRHPDRLLLALADRVPGRRSRNVPQHVRRSHDDLSRQPQHQRLAGHRGRDPLVLGRGGGGGAPHARPGVDRGPASSRRPANAGRRGCRRADR